MFRGVCSSLSLGRLVSRSCPTIIRQCDTSASIASCRFSSALSTAVSNNNNNTPDDDVLSSMSYKHHGKRPRFREQPKFKSPRKRASSLLKEIEAEGIELSKQSKPKVWDVPFKVGDAIEIEAVIQGGVNSTEIEKLRGVVIGIYRKRLDYSVLIRDVVFGEPIERRIPLHSPLLRSLKVLEENFVFKGKREVKRAKLYYLRTRNPLGKRIYFIVRRTKNVDPMRFF